jgi:signal transduction histidine kinase
MKSLSNKRILVVDDNASIHQDFLKILSANSTGSSTLQAAEAVLFGPTVKPPSQTHFDLDFAFQGQEALEKVEKALQAGSPYAVAFVDIRMPPGWDGVETIGRLWKADPNLQTVICTAYSDYSWEDMAEQLEISDRLLILKKPFDNIEVLQLAHALARKWEVTLQAKLRMEHLDQMVDERTSALQSANESLQLEMAERSRLEGQLRHAQKMEAIGQLAAGIAHDFNNILTVISGYTSLQLTKNPDPATAESLRQMADASDRATNLTRQLLTFSRKQIMQPKVLDINDLLHHLSKMLRRIIGEDITLHSQCAPKLPCIFADPTNMEQIILNLAVNARDAMPNGGQFTIKTFSESFQPADLPRTNPDATPGQFVCLQVSDSGCGMDASTLGRIFEPFFTTKEVGKGTGMGLATVYGIVKQHEGWIEVQSELGKGTTFFIHLPASEHANSEQATQTTEAPLAHGEGHLILVVEDDATIRQLVQEILEYYHYEVITATDSEEALALWKERSAEVGLLLTDMVMPGGKSGRDLAEQLSIERPDLKVVYTTGYSADLFGSKLRLEEGANYLPKPYLASDLARIVRKALDS